uniref:Uncharacterized protein n=1 Tax=Geladintestivirus 6 TaxID=3233138 RepID=A0AAU8MLA1_9CAUD
MYNIKSSIKINLLLNIYKLFANIKEKPYLYRVLL